MIYCPAGSFMMGSPAPQKQNGLLGLIGMTEGGELGRNNDETQHQVIISKPFYIGKFPITQKQYKTILSSDPLQTLRENFNSIVDSPSSIIDIFNPSKSNSKRKKSLIQRRNEERKKRYSSSNPSRFSYEGDNKPVECIGWYEAKYFCKLLNSQYKNYLPQGYKFALPSEAQ